MDAGGDRGGAAAIDRRKAQTPKTADYLNIDFDVFGDLMSFFVRSVNLIVSRDLDEKMEPLALAGGTGKISTILLTGANPGIRPSVLAHFIQKDRSAMGKLIERMERAGLLKQKISATERRARELYLTDKGRAMVPKVRAVIRRQDDDFFGMLTPGERRKLLALLRKIYSHHVDMVPTTE
ncbi:MAG: MarR family winged helix-turn-helix transcriptional regulator [Hyphomicrobiales bacterium]|jgi:DNA-binding MarR family transcriptional regulator